MPVPSIRATWHGNEAGSCDSGRNRKSRCQGPKLLPQQQPEEEEQRNGLETRWSKSEGERETEYRSYHSNCLLAVKDDFVEIILDDDQVSAVHRMNGQPEAPYFKYQEERDGTGGYIRE